MKGFFRSLIKRFQPEDYVKRCRSNYKKGLAYYDDGTLFNVREEEQKLFDTCYDRWIEKYPDWESEMKGGLTCIGKKDFKIGF